MRELIKTVAIVAVALCLGAGIVTVGAPAGAGLVDQGQRAFERGAFGEAATEWSKALQSFQANKNTNAQVATLVSLAGAYQAIGQQQHAVQHLEDALSLAEKTPNYSRLSWVKSRLGAALILTRKYDRATRLLAEALSEARADNDQRLTAAILNDQGNALIAAQEYATALASYQESAALARQVGMPLLHAQAMCNAAATAAQAAQDQTAEDLNGQALLAIEPLAQNHAKGFLLLRAGQTDRNIKTSGGEVAARLLKRAHRSFQAALDLGQMLGDRFIETYALGYLGQAYEQDGQLDAAIGLTRRAIFVAQQGQMPEALYRWQWQLGRWLNRKGEALPAITAYRSAVQTLQPIRNDVSLGYGNSVSTLGFRESQGPLFFELADLLLQQSKAAGDSPRTRDLLLEARDTVEQLKTVELEDYFRDECVDIQKARTRKIEAVDPRTAVIYYISLPTRIELLIGLTSGLSRFTVAVPAEKLAGEVREFRRNLETRTSYGYLAQSRQLYDWLIRPVHDVLTTNNIDTLVFVPDGALRTIPFAALQDGERFLIEDFAVAVTPGLSLVEPHPLKQEKAHLLLNGVSESVQGFPRLDFVRGELKSIEPLYRSSTLLDQQFTAEEFGRRLSEEQYSIVHIASHGQFDRDVTKTFVLAYDSKLTLNNLEALIRPGKYRGRPVEFLVLSACQTAAGDDRAALGLAGVAVKAGARSALATLWFVNDQSSSALTSEVYAQLRGKPMQSKARALQAAQVKLLHDRRYHHPCYWSPFLIIGNWL